MATTHKNILVLCGHPDDESLCGSLANKYAEGALKAGHQVKVTHLSHLRFDPILHKGYQRIQDLEPDLQQAQKDLLWADHVVVVTPIWWSSVPALLKGFLDRVLLPGFAFKYHSNSPFWDRLLKGRTARLIITTDAPWFWNFLVNRDPVIRMMKVGVLEFCGIKPVGVSQFDSIKSRRPEQIQKFLERAFQLGQRGK